MRTIEINKIDSESYQKLNDFANSNEWSIWVILNSWWWESVYWHLISWLLNMNKDRIKLIMASWCYSAAFRVFHDYKWERAMVYWSRGMRHQWFQSITMNDSWTITYQEDRIIAENNKETFTPPYKWMTKKEKNQYMKWKDVYFLFSRMKEIFPDVEIIK